MSPEYHLLCARSSATARGEMKAVLEGVFHKWAPHWISVGPHKVMSVTGRYPEGSSACSRCGNGGGEPSRAYLHGHGRKATWGNHRTLGYRWLHLCECSAWVSKAQESPATLLTHTTNVNKGRFWAGTTSRVQHCCAEH